MCCGAWLHPFLAGGGRLTGYNAGHESMAYTRIHLCYKTSFFQNTRDGSIG